MELAPSATLHAAEHEGLWGLAGARCEIAQLWIVDFWLEFVQYTDPVAVPRADDYRLSDLGILNICVGTRAKKGYEEIRGRTAKAGYKAEDEATMRYQCMTYVFGHEGLSVELAYTDLEMAKVMGLIPDPR